MAVARRVQRPRRCACAGPLDWVERTAVRGAGRAPTAGDSAHSSAITATWKFKSPRSCNRPQNYARTLHGVGYGGVEVPWQPFSTYSANILATPPPHPLPCAASARVVAPISVARFFNAMQHFRAWHMPPRGRSAQDQVPMGAVGQNGMQGPRQAASGILKTIRRW